MVGRRQSFVLTGKAQPAEAKLFIYFSGTATYFTPGAHSQPRARPIEPVTTAI
jgi:hypothetical protein